jgi:hypothetical protein
VRSLKKENGLDEWIIQELPQKVLVVPKVVHPNESVDFVSQVMSDIEVPRTLVDLQDLLSGHGVDNGHRMWRTQRVPLDFQNKVPNSELVVTEDIQKVAHASHNVEYGVNLVLVLKAVDEPRAIPPTSNAHDGVK